ncbi:MAG: peptidoglycan bridge formation glycyltransferase FemA/FemB family protein, partial [Patescibacteria group bacterium]
FDPAWVNLPLIPSFVRRGGFRRVGQVQPKKTLILDLEKSEEEILAQMKSKTRYNIKVAEKHGIKIDFFLDLPLTPSLKQGGGTIPPSPLTPSLKQGGGESRLGEGLEEFWQLMQKTSARQEIVPHPKIYYQKLLETLGEKGIIKLIVAKFEDKIIAANLVAFFGDWCAYLHGASDYEHREKMAPFLLQWETMKMAKETGKKYYDFWGVDEKKWPGVTRFKTGFAPEEKITEYAGAYDIVYSRMWYNGYRILKKILNPKS